MCSSDLTSTIAWEGDPVYGGRTGLWREYEGGYEDWKLQRDRAQSLRGQATKVAASVKGAPPAAKTAAVAPAAKARKLSYKEQRELDELPGRIEALESEQKELAEFLAGPESYTVEPERALKAQTRVAAIDDELLAALERWELLGAK